ncbi:MAG: family 10 glycosylhydrolase [Clostridiales bacterium]|nr:family 10 glycosylhydrolase [Clostridiales bacterium]
MKKIITLAMAIIFITSAFNVNSKAITFDNQMRAVWITTVYNLDFPLPNTINNIEAQKKEYIKTLDIIMEAGLNSVVVQVRPKSDALYKSAINPWSDVLTGVQGKDPGYDPMQFMIEEAHKRDIEFHAWLNPYRVSTPNYDINKLSANHPAKLDPSMIFKYDNTWYYNPELESVKQHIVKTVEEIVTNYDVDGIHFDDYFYPANYPLPTGESKDGPVANARRDHISDMIARVHSAIKAIDKNVRFGVSPISVWKNISSDPTGSNTHKYSNEAYYYSAADTRKWIQNGWIDYIVPQVYFYQGHTMVDYETIVSWWNKEVEGTNVDLYIGQGIYNDRIALEIGSQLAINQKYENVKGSFYYRSNFLINNHYGGLTQISKFNMENPIEIKFTDVSENHWGKPNIEYIVRKGGIAGYIDGSFKPENQVTRIEFIKILAGSLGVKRDENREWYDSYKDYADQMGMTALVPVNTEAERNAIITREEVAKVLSYASFTPINSDLSFIKYPCSDYSMNLAIAGIFIGDDKGNMRDSSALSRAEAATIVSRVVNANMRIQK